MKKVEVLIYKCSEFKEGSIQREKAHKYLEQVANEQIIDELYSTELEEFWEKTELPLLGYINAKVECTVAYAQGDGARFCCVVDIPKWVKAHKDIYEDVDKYYKAVKNCNPIAIIKPTLNSLYLRYTHENTVELSITYEENPKGIQISYSNLLYKVIETDAKNTMRQVYTHMVSFLNSIFEDLYYLEECFPEIWFLEDGSVFLHHEC